MRFQKIFILFFASLLAFGQARADINVRWVHHPTLDIYSYLYNSSYVKNLNGAMNNVQKLVETDRYLYALISGGLHLEVESGVNAYSQVPYFLARVDKADPDAKMEAVATHLNVSGLGIEAIEYSSSAGCVAVAYDNGSFDFIYDDGRLVSTKDLKYFTQPGGRKVRSISFNLDSSKVVAATDFGVVIISTSTGEIEKLINFSAGVDFANLLGDKLVVASDGILRSCPVSSVPAALESMPVLGSSEANAPAGVLSEGAVRHSFGLYPVSDRSMVFLAPALASNVDGVSVNMLTLPEDAVSEDAAVKNILTTSVNFAMTGCRPDVAPSFRELSLVAPTRRGLVLRTENDVYAIDWVKDGSEDNVVTEENPVSLSTWRLPQTAAPDPQQGPERYKPITTRDGENFWVFRPRLGFQKRTVTGTGTKAVWSDAGEVVGVNALTAGMPRYIHYSPVYGLMARADGRNNDFTNDIGQGDGLCSYRDGVWTQHSLMLTNFKTGWMRSGNNMMMGNSCGAYPDPELPHYVYTRGTTVGIRRQNLEDPSDVLLMTRSNYASEYANRAVITEPQTGSSYSTAVRFSEFDTDNDGTLWTSFRRLKSNAYPVMQAEFWYWPLEDRKAVLKSGDYADHPMKIIALPGVEVGPVGYVYCGHQEKNRNLLFNLSDNYDEISFVLDHNGTPDDTSDDKYVIFENLIDDNGDACPKIYFAERLIEDPYDGSFIITSRDGIMVTDSEMIFSKDGPHFSWLNPVNPANGIMHSHFGQGGVDGVVGLAVDGQGRKWMAFESGPIVCLSEDRSTILAEFDSENSPLPKTNFLNLIYNPETNSIFVSSYHGLTELVLEGTPNIHAKDVPSVSPNVVESHFHGYVNFFGLTDTGTYALTAPDGTEIPLPQPVDGRIQFHPTGYAPGLYKLKGTDVELLINR